MKAYRSPLAQTRRDAWTEINLSHIQHNVKQVKSVIGPDVKIMAVVKADSYGHGAAMVTKILGNSGVNMFGVAAVDEGIQLRIAKIKQPVLILGPTPLWAIESAVTNNLDITIFADAHLKDCINVAQKLQYPINVHIKIDTGMHRIGVDYKKAHDLIMRACASKEINLKGIFSHLACAEDPEKSIVQIERWNKVIEKLNQKPEYLHFTNSSAISVYKDIHYNLVRTGLEIYGLQPDLPADQSKPDLKQAMALRGRITHLHTAQPGEGVSYGYSYKVSDKPVTIATLPIGYADGVSRNLSNKIYGIINGQKVPQVGNITMDQMMFDVSGLDNVAPGNIITLLGEADGEFVSIDSWAEILNTINYEIPCLLKVRLPRVYTS